MSLSQRHPKLSIIIPLYNEADSLPKLFERLDSVCQTLDVETEKILVDNCSDDLSAAICKQKTSDDDTYVYIRFSRNFGPAVDSSIAAGYEHATGDAALVLYSDLQDPPEVIPQFVAKWREGYDVVYGVRTVRHGEPMWRRISIKVFYRLMRKISDVAVPVDAGDFRLISRRVIDVLNHLDERARYTRGLISWVGFPQASISYKREPRFGGQSKANLFAITRTAMTAITSFSLGPLRLLTGIGLLISCASSLAIVASVLVAIFGQPLPGMTTLIVLNLFTLGVLMLSVGILGEYIGRIHTESKRRPLYIIEEHSRGLSGAEARKNEFDDPV